MPDGFVPGPNDFNVMAHRTQLGDHLRIEPGFKFQGVTGLPPGPSK